MSAAEIELLAQIRYEMKQANAEWSTCPVVATLMYNVVVEECALVPKGVFKRSFRVIQSCIGTVDEIVQMPTRSTTTSRLFTLDTEKSKSDVGGESDEEGVSVTVVEHPEAEDAFYACAFQLIRTSAFSSKPKVFRHLIDFVACASNAFPRRTTEFVDRRWASLLKRVGSEKKKLERGSKATANESVPTVADLQLTSLADEFESHIATDTISDTARSCETTQRSSEVNVVVSTKEFITKSAVPTKARVRQRETSMSIPR